jgi:hypothetical protein
MRIRKLLPISALILGLCATYASAREAKESTEELAKESQNPVADLISVPFQNNTNFQAGPYHETGNILNIQPVIPIQIDEDWNLITRTIIPVIAQVRTSPFEGPVLGLGDINPSFFLSPAKPGSLIWGFGPTFTFPSATANVLGTGKWTAGPTAVALTIQGPWVIGLLVNNVWSFAGEFNRARVNQMTAQYFVNYNFRGGWYLTSTPIITADWVAKPGDQWTAPIGGGFGRVFKIDKQAINAQIQAFYNVARPFDGPHWQIRFQLAFLFPT